MYKANSRFIGNSTPRSAVLSVAAAVVYIINVSVLTVAWFG